MESCLVRALRGQIRPRRLKKAKSRKDGCSIEPATAGSRGRPDFAGDRTQSCRRFRRLRARSRAAVDGRSRSAAERPAARRHRRRRLRARLAAQLLEASAAAVAPAGYQFFCRMAGRIVHSRTWTRRKTANAAAGLRSIACKILSAATSTGRAGVETASILATLFAVDAAWTVLAPQRPNKTATDRFRPWQDTSLLRIS